jgi:hypothetical protein
MGLAAVLASQRWKAEGASLVGSTSPPRLFLEATRQPKSWGRWHAPCKQADRPASLSMQSARSQVTSGASVHAAQQVGTNLHGHTSLASAGACCGLLQARVMSGSCQ